MKLFGKVACKSIVTPLDSNAFLATCVTSRPLSHRKWLLPLLLICRLLKIRPRYLQLLTIRRRSIIRHPLKKISLPNLAAVLCYSVCCSTTVQNYKISTNVPHSSTGSGRSRAWTERTNSRAFVAISSLNLLSCTWHTCTACPRKNIPPPSIIV